MSPECFKSNCAPISRTRLACLDPIYICYSTHKTRYFPCLPSDRDGGDVSQGLAMICKHAMLTRRHSIASAVAVVPEDSEMDSYQNGLKRRQSDASDPENNDSKRRRTSAGKNSPEDRLASKTETDAQPDSPNHAAKPAQKPEQGRDARRRSAVPDDKQRSKRLFGALLGNLNASQPNDRAAKRRADIEARRKAELAKQDNERLEDKQRRLRELAQHRKKQQIYVDEEDVSYGRS